MLQLSENFLGDQWVGVLIFLLTFEDLRQQQGSKNSNLSGTLSSSICSPYVDFVTKRIKHMPSTDLVREGKIGSYRPLNGVRLPMGDKIQLPLEITKANFLHQTYDAVSSSEF